MDSTDDPLGNLPPQLQQIIQLALTAFIQANLSEIYIMIVASLWLGISFSLFMALLYSSSSKSRQTPIFWFGVVAVGFGTVPSILFLNLLLQAFVKALGVTTEFMKPYIFALSFFTYFSSICVDSILLLRIFAVFPPSRMSRKQVTVIFGPLLLVKLGRIITVIVVVINFIKHSRTVSPEHPSELYTMATELPEPKAAWALQLADNSICSFLFLYKLYGIRSFSLQLNRKTSYVKLLQTLFLIAISNFIFPVIFVIIQFIFLTRPISYLAMACLNVSGVNIEVIGVLFATIWSGQVIDKLKTDDEESNIALTHEVEFRNGQTLSAETGTGNREVLTTGASFTTMTEAHPSMTDHVGEQEDASNEIIYLKSQDDIKVE